MTSLILVTATRFLTSVLLLFSLFLLLRGHHEPGGGFAGGLVAAGAFTLVAIATDARTARQALKVDPRSLVGAGLLIALGAGTLGIFVGRPLLTGQWYEVALPGGGHLEVGTPLVFDIGVYLVVLGVALTIILTLAEE